MARRTQLELIVAILAALFLAAILFSADPIIAGRMSALEQREAAYMIAHGAELYEANCRSCHGINGEGVGELGPSLNDRTFYEDRLKTIGWQGTLGEYVSASIAQGRIAATRPLYAGDGNVVMTAWSQQYGGPLRPDEIAALTAFVLNWEDTALGVATLEPVMTPTPSPEDLAAQAGEGRKVFSEAGCAECHAVEGLSKATAGPDLSHIGADATTRKPGLSAELYLRESFLMPNAHRVAGYPDDVQCGGVLSRSQLDSLVAFLLNLR
jgi:mono/diheme cytochrome c family protein